MLHHESGYSMIVAISKKNEQICQKYGITISIVLIKLLHTNKTDTIIWRRKKSLFQFFMSSCKLVIGKKRTFEWFYGAFKTCLQENQIRNGMFIKLKLQCPLQRVGNLAVIQSAINSDDSTCSMFWERLYVTSVSTWEHPEKIWKHLLNIWEYLSENPS